MENKQNSIFDKSIRILVLGKGKNIYYLLETLYYLLRKKFYVHFTKNWYNEMKNRETINNPINILIVTYDEYLKNVSTEKNKICSLLNHNLTELIGELNKKFECQNKPKYDFTFWEPIFKYIKEKPKDLDIPLSLIIPVIYRYEFNFKLIDDIIDCYLPHIIIITSDEPYQNIRTHISSNWGIKSLRELEGPEHEKKYKPYIIVNYEGTDKKSIEDSAILSRAILKFDEIPNDMPPMIFPDCVTSSYHETVDMNLGIIETIRYSKKQNKIPIEINICVHDIIGTLCKISLGFSGFKIEPDLDNSSENNKSFIVPNLHYLTIQKLSKKYFTCNCLAKFTILEVNDLKQYIKEREPIIGSLFHFLSTKKELWIEEYGKGKKIKEYLEYLNKIRYILYKINSYYKVGKCKEEIKSEKEINKDKRRWIEFKKQKKRKCCIGRLECAIYSFLTTLEVDYRFKDKKSKENDNKPDDKREFKDFNIENCYFELNLNCKNCVYKSLPEELSKEPNENWAIIQFCGEEAEEPGALGNILTKLIPAKTISMEENNKNKNEYVFNMSYLKDFECIKAETNFLKIYGTLEIQNWLGVIPKVRKKKEGKNPPGKLNALMIISFGEKEEPKIYSEYLKNIQNKLNKESKSNKLINNDEYELFVNETNKINKEHTYLLIRTEKNKKNDAIEYQRSRCNECPASDKTCIIKRRIIETPKGERMKEMRRTIKFVNFEKNQ